MSWSFLSTREWRTLPFGYVIPNDKPWNTPVDREHIKLLYLVSFFFSVTTYGPVSDDEGVPYEPITAVAHLDAAMAQLSVCSLFMYEYQ